MSLLQDAKKLKARMPCKKFTADDEELVLAWMADEISLGQVARVKKLNAPTNAYPYIAMVARQIFRGNKR